MPELQELFHDFANRISAMNNALAMAALSYLDKGLNSFTAEEKAELLDKLTKAVKKAHNAYNEIMDADNRIIEALPLSAATAIAVCIEDIMDVIHKAERKNSELSAKLFDYNQDTDFESYIKPILQEALEFDKQMATIAQKLEEAKGLLRKQGLYPKPGDEDYA